MNRRAFLLSALITPLAAVMPVPYQLKPRSLGMSRLVASSQGFDSFFNNAFTPTSSRFLDSKFDEMT